VRGADPAVIARALEAELDRFAAHLDARGGPPAFFTEELAVHTRRCLARVLAVAALEGNAGPIRAAGRRLESKLEPERRRALDLLQEVTATRPRLLALVERWLAPSPKDPAGAAARARLAEVDPWLSVAPPAAAERVRELRRDPIYADVPGPDLAAEAQDTVEIGVGRLRALVARLR
jgi:hypothetical protein